MDQPSHLPVVLGTSNSEKLRELSLLLSGLPLKLLPGRDLELGPAPYENGTTHHENASLKAQHWSEKGDGLAIASDGGLVIPSMFGKWSSLYTNRTFIQLEPRERQCALLELLDQYQISDRSAFWLEAVSVALKGNVMATWIARSSGGEIAVRVDEQIAPSEFWVKGIWNSSGFGKVPRSPETEERDMSPDHWLVLYSQVQRFFKHYVWKA